MRDIKAAHKRLQLAYEHLLIEWLRRHPDLPPPFLTQVYRSPAEQAAYFAQGRQPLAKVNSLRKMASLGPITAAENKGKVTSSPPGKSKHEKTPAEAIDLAFLKKGTQVLNWDPSNFQRAYDILREFDPGIRWGKYFSKLVDLPHFEI